MMDLDYISSAFRDSVQVLKTVFLDVSEVTVRELRIIDGIFGVTSVENKRLDCQLPAEDCIITSWYPSLMTRSS